MDHIGRFEGLISEMKADGRYRTFVELERMAGQFPAALLRGRDGRSRRVTVWCSNDYLGMGQHPDVLAAMHDAIFRFGAGTGGTRNAISPGPTGSMSSSKPSLPTFMARGQP